MPSEARARGWPVFTTNCFVILEEPPRLHVSVSPFVKCSFSEVSPQMHSSSRLEMGRFIFHKRASGAWSCLEVDPNFPGITSCLCQDKKETARLSPGG